MKKKAPFQMYPSDVVCLTPQIRQDADNQLRTAGYEVINSFVANAANDSLQAVGTLSNVILERLQQTVPMQQQVVSVEDRITLEEMQTSLTSVLLVRTPFTFPTILSYADCGLGYCSTTRDGHQAPG